MGARWPRYAVACASWDWSRDLNGTSVVSVLRDLIWTVLAAQPKLQKHLEEAVQATDRRPLLGGNINDLQARYAVLGTSCDFYAMLALLCSIVGDPEFAPTCFVQDSLWAYQPRRLSISEDTDGQYLLHTEIGVWVLPSLPTDGKAGLQPSPRYPCSVVRTGAHMAILWQTRLLTKIPPLYAPFQPYYFASFTCEICTVDGGTSGLLVGTDAGHHLHHFRFRGKETIAEATGEMDLP
ncbi:hypothetical protein ISF_05491 [Cordyceps fumosorosea ARSEF 2679]|uniref:Uncharacterized protein n=1 Tax=Cordyceps fumosorosea (strain ARSEF 2679) TaxID=1081104 RepID=A0A167UBD1_CORFA|nr:hypothetical protein ISF_05491 [Cordyceps fumosorosea ARSEF 2679]OAA61412.1 hypothetical protein ISF_05491 [Cordyceps fumosorosea ARSEF 2679]